MSSDPIKFVQGYSSGAKAGRGAFHSAADVLTLGLWEVLGTPVEMAADGNEVKVKVAYDARECVDYIQVLKGDDQLNKRGKQQKVAEFFPDKKSPVWKIHFGAGAKPPHTNLRCCRPIRR